MRTGVKGREILKNFLLWKLMNYTASSTTNSGAISKTLKTRATVKA